MAQTGITPDGVPLVYLVDDDPAMRSSLEVLLATAQINVRSFASAEAFLEAFDSSRPACVLLDVRLPGITGLELLQHLVKTGSNAAVVVITGHGDIPMAVSAMRAGAMHFMEKPIDAASLLEIVEEACSCAGLRCDRNHHMHLVSRRFASLTLREKDVLGLMVEGHPTKVIAYRLGITRRTVEHHRAAVMYKMQARTISHLVKMALEISGKSKLADEH